MVVKNDVLEIFIEACEVTRGPKKALKIALENSKKVGF